MNELAVTGKLLTFNEMKRHAMFMCK